MFRDGAPNGLRSRVSGLKGQRPSPLDDGSLVISARTPVCAAVNPSSVSRSESTKTRVSADSVLTGADELQASEPRGREPEFAAVGFSSVAGEPTSHEQRAEQLLANLLSGYYERTSEQTCDCGHHITLMHWLWGCDGLTESGEPCSCRGRGYVEGKGIYSTAHVDAVLSRWSRDGVPSC